MASSEVFLLDPAHRPFLADQPSRGKFLLKTRLWVLSMAAAMALGLFLAGKAGLEWGRWFLLQGDYAVAPAEIVRRHKDWVGEGGPYFFVTYRFETSTPTGPATFTREQQVNSSTYARLHVGETVQVRCHNLFPQVSSIVEDTSFRNGISAGALMWLPVAVFMGWKIRGYRREIRLGKQGQLLSGRVTQCTGRLDPEGDFIVELQYRFTAPGGQVIRDKASACRQDLKDATLPEKDKPVAVLYLDARTYKVL